MRGQMAIRPASRPISLPIRVLPSWSPGVDPCVNVRSWDASFAIGQQTTLVGSPLSNGTVDRYRRCNHCGMTTMKRFLAGVGIASLAATSGLSAQAAPGGDYVIRN